MSQARTPDLRRWIRVEIEPKGLHTRAKDLDLNMVDSVMWIRNADDTIDSCKITSAAEMKPFILLGDEARYFYEKWMAHSGIVEDMSRNKPGLILAADTNRFN